LRGLLSTSVSMTSPSSTFQLEGLAINFDIIDFTFNFVCISA
jgi:hypothetical protein